MVLFLSPEQLARDEVVARLGEQRVAQVVVDEAHCISAWGHDFRPDYLRLGDVVDGLGHPPVLALTATAPPPVRDEVVERLACATRSSSSAARPPEPPPRRASARRGLTTAEAVVERGGRAGGARPPLRRDPPRHDGLRGAARRAGAPSGRVPRRAAGGRAPRGARAVRRRHGRCRRRDLGVRHGHRQARHPLRRPRRHARARPRATTRRSGAAGATVPRRPQCSSTARRTSRCTGSTRAGASTSSSSAGSCGGCDASGRAHAPGAGRRSRGLHPAGLGCRQPPGARGGRASRRLDRPVDRRDAQGRPAPGGRWRRGCVSAWAGRAWT